MGNPGKSRIAIVAVLALAAAACHRGEDSKQLAALDSAFKAGVITKSEYDAKKAALAQLAALEKARDAGILTPAEYQDRKAKLTGVLPPPAVPEETPATPAATTAASAPAAAPLLTPVAAATGGFRQEHIFDPHLNLNAYDVSVPASWKFDGVYVPGSSCVQIPFPVFRMYSPDGLTEIRRLPRFDWSWSTGKFKGQQQSDCLDLKQDMSAQEFLKYLIGMMQVAYIRDYPLPQAAIDAQQKNFEQTNKAMEASAARMDQMNASLPSMRNQPKNKPATQHGGLAAAIAEYRNGTFTIEEEIGVRLMCMHAPINFGPDRDAFTESCNATVRIVRAPKGKLDAVMAQTQKAGAAQNAEWMSKYLEYQQAVWKARSDKMFADSNARHEIAARRIRAWTGGSCAAAPAVHANHAGRHRPLYGSRHASRQLAPRHRAGLVRLRARPADGDRRRRDRQDFERLYADVDRWEWQLLSDQRSQH